jgi:hypothetical protein
MAMPRPHLAAMRVRSTLLAGALALSAFAAPAAWADQPIATASPGAPPPGAAPRPLDQDDQSPEAIGAWARGVMADAAAPAAAGPPAAPGCVPAAPDGKPHGEVWAGAGTHGYREAGGVVTQPLGGCGSLTIGVSSTRGGWR